MGRTLEGQRAVVTGASSGIGRAIAVALSREGAAMTLHARSNQSALEETKAHLACPSQASSTLLADLSDPEQCVSLVESAWRQGPVDIWVHNAGADVLTGHAADWSFEEKLDRLWRVDVRGAISCCRLIGERMKRRGSGVILTIGWDQAELGMEGDSGQMFAATKAAVMAFTKSLAKSLSPAVRVNCLAPGWIKTKWGEGASDDWDRRAIAESLVGRWGEPADVSHMAAVLASPKAAFITGQVIAINGGFAGSASRPADKD